MALPSDPDADVPAGAVPREHAPNEPAADDSAILFHIIISNAEKSAGFAGNPVLEAQTLQREPRGIFAARRSGEAWP